jgi:type I pantothenate kinase
MKLPHNYTIHWNEMLARLHEGFVGRGRSAGAWMMGVGGGVAAGKTTFAEMLREKMALWPERPKVEIISTDGFLFSNKTLADKQLSGRKGFPESYDVVALEAAIEALRRGTPVSVPLYSHVVYDVEPNASQTIDRADIAILDGLHLGLVKRNRAGKALIDRLIYLDAAEGDIERWFRDRLFPLMVSGRTNPDSFYYAFREMDDAAAMDFIRRVWTGINLPNLRDHVVQDRDSADIVVRKAGNHAVEAVTFNSE